MKKTYISIITGIITALSVSFAAFAQQDLTYPPFSVDSINQKTEMP